MKLKILITLAFILIISCKSEKKKTINSINTEEWISLFNGKDLSDWTIKFTGEDLNVNHKETFIIEDSMIRINYDNYENFNGKFAHMYFKNPYSYYKLKFDYRFTGKQTKGGGSLEC